MRLRLRVVALLLLAGCAPTVEGPAMTESTPDEVTPVVSPYPSNRPPLQSAPPLPSPFGTPVEATPDQLEAIRADLRSRDVDPSALTVISADRATWNDGSWGCPQPGMGYTQALVEGYRVVVEVDGATFDYRFGAGPKPRLCVRSPKG